MHRSDFEKYAALFYSEDITVVKDGRTYKGREGMYTLKTFTSSRMNETIDVKNFLTDGLTAFVEMKYGWEAMKDLEQADFERNGFGETFSPLKKGETSMRSKIYVYTLDPTGTLFTSIREFSEG
ncbi:hypothetical protein FE257_010440 [Aspergillus nanangensis]|uniref:Uncharacterized protein n=1 Tax=Aspergillus nanangensis TaxID=2582783 RepID=A0AAD4GS33_ASPNN|nr:hypothetical protein FE257_010440 [Aspergillus nanangensis]